MRKIFHALLAGAVALGLASPVLAQDKVIKLGTMSWEDLTPITGITKKVLEDKGYTVEVTPFSEWGIAYAALTKGDVQAMVSQIDYAAQDYWQKNKNRLKKISPVSHGLYQGIVVPKYVPIDSIEQLNENADKFGGKIVGIEPGSRDARSGRRGRSIRAEAATGRGLDRCHDCGAEIGGGSQGLGGGDRLGTVLDGAEIRHQVPQGS